MSTIVSVFTTEPEVFRDNADREELALVAPQVSVDPDDPALKEAAARKRVYYKNYDPIYPGIDYAEDASGDID